MPGEDNHLDTLAENLPVRISSTWLKELISEAREQAEAALGDCIKWFDSGEVQGCFAVSSMRDPTRVSKEFSDWAGSVWSNAKQFLQNPAAKAGEKLETLLNAASQLISWLVVMEIKEGFKPSATLRDRIHALDKEIGSYDQGKVFGVEVTIEPYEGVKGDV